MVDKKVTLLYALKDKVSSASKKMSGSLKKFASTSLKSKIGLAALAGASVAAVRDFAILDDKLRDTVNLVKGSEDDLKGFGDAISIMAVNTSQSANDLAQGLFDVVSSGQSAADGMKVLDQAAKLATAGATDVATAANGLTNVLNAYGLEAEHAEAVSESLFQTQVLGKTTIEELSKNLGRVAPQAKEAGISIDELGAAFATITSVGINTAEASTAVGALVSSFTDASKEGSKANEIAQQLGVDFSLAAIKTDGLAGVMKNLSTAFKEQNIPADRQQVILKDLVKSQQAVKAILPLLADESGNFTAKLESMGEKAGSVSDAFSVKKQGMAATMNSAIQAVKALGRSLAELLAPAIILITKGLTRLVVGVRENVETFKTFIKENKAIQAVINHVSNSIKSLIDFIAAWNTALFKIKNSNSKAKDSLEALIKVGTALFDVFKSLSRILTGLATIFANKLEPILAKIEPFTKGLATFVGKVAKGYKLLADSISDVAEETKKLPPPPDQSQEQTVTKTEKNIVQQEIQSSPPPPAIKQDTEEISPIEVLKEQAQQEIEIDKAKLDKKNENLQAAKETERELEAEHVGLKQEAAIEEDEAEREREAEHVALKQEAAIAEDEAVAELQQQKEDREVAANKRKLSRDERLSAKEVELAQYTAFLSSNIDKESKLGKFNTALQSAGKIFSLNKALSIKEMLILQKVALAKAFSTFPPNIALLAQVATNIIGGISFVKNLSLREGGTVKVPGQNTGNDSVQALLQPGETVISRDLTERLEQILSSGALGVNDGQSGGGDTPINLVLDSEILAKTSWREIKRQQSRGEITE